MINTARRLELLLAFAYLPIVPWARVQAQNASVCCHTSLPCPNRPKNCGPPLTSAPSAPAEPHTPAWVQAIVYKPLFFKDDRSTAHHSVWAGVCIYLDGQRDKPPKFPDYNWEQQYYALTDEDPKKCDPKHWHQDPCPRPTQDDSHHMLFRPEPARVSFTDSNPMVKDSWHAEFLFRDLPRRELPETFIGGPLQYWRARTDFVGVLPGDVGIPLVKNINYGFVISGPLLTLLPLKFRNLEVVPMHTYDLRTMKPPMATTKTQDPCIATNQTLPEQPQPILPMPPREERFGWH